MENTPSYYSVITANVRYDKRLVANAKLLYGEVTALCNEKGYCWATNEYFASLYDVSKETVSRWISSLVEFGYLKSEIKHKENSNQIEKRILSISNPIDEKIIGGIDKKVKTPIDKKVNDNNTRINNIKLHSVASLPELVKLETGIEPLHYLIAKSYHNLFLETKGEMKSLVNAGLKKWTDIVRMLLQNDKVSLEQIIAIKIYLDDCKDEVRGTDKFWIDTIFSINALRKKNIDGVYYFDMIGYRVKKWLRDGGNERRVFTAKEKIKNQLEKYVCSVKGV